MEKYQVFVNKTKIFYFLKYNFIYKFFDFHNDSILKKEENYSKLGNLISRTIVINIDPKRYFMIMGSYGGSKTILEIEKKKVPIQKYIASRDKNFCYIWAGLWFRLLTLKKNNIPKNYFIIFDYLTINSKGKNPDINPKTIQCLLSFCKNFPEKYKIQEMADSLYPIFKDSLFWKWDIKKNPVRVLEYSKKTIIRSKFFEEIEMIPDYYFWKLGSPIIQMVDVYRNYKTGTKFPLFDLELKIN